MLWDKWCVTKMMCDKVLVKDGVRQMVCVCDKDGVCDKTVGV